MNRSRKVIEVYRELRRVLGGEVDAGELLACASEIIEIARQDELGQRNDQRLGPVPFEETTLDVLFERWGWKLVSQEFHPEDDVMPGPNHSRLIDQLFAEAA